MLECCDKSGGTYNVSTITAHKVLNFAKKHEIDCVWIAVEDWISMGIGDLLMKHDIAVMGGTKAACKIEWDKQHGLEYAKKVDSEIVPNYSILDNKTSITAFNTNSNIVVKPVGLAEGRGVRVMPEQLPDLDAAKKYATQCLKKGKVLFVEKLVGDEFTYSAFSDGKRLEFCPITRDYPYSREGDTGKQTAGIGCYTQADGLLPFLTKSDAKKCRKFMKNMLKQLQSGGHDFKGVMNCGFFKTKSGIKFMEMNMRPGNPEIINILELYEGNLVRLLESIQDGKILKMKFKKNINRDALFLPT